MITFHNVKDEDGKIIHIDEITKNNRAKHYYCIGCGGEMSAVLGENRDHHFRHKKAHCSWESYLHKLGKMQLKQRFESSNTFVVKYYVESHCDKLKGCILRDKKCNGRFLLELDLKKDYDTCEEEVMYKGYRADLMLSSKEHPELEPIFLEISVTHDCEADKRDSGIQIIELKIADEKDVLRPLVEEDSSFGRSNHEYTYILNSMSPIRFYNFKRKIETTRPFERFWVAKDEKGILRGYCSLGDLTCRNVETNHREDSVYEVAISSELFVNYSKPNLYEFGMMKAIGAGIDVKHCGICKNNIACNLKNNADDKVALANGCKFYSQVICGLNKWQILNSYCWEWKPDR